MPDTVTQRVYDREDPGGTIRHFLGYQFDLLGIGEHWTSTGTSCGLPMVDNRIPPGLGCCRAHAAVEALWPDGADLGAVVTWSPDREIADRGNSAELDEHRRVRGAAVLKALTSLGYQVRTPGPLQGYSTPWVPTKYVVYRMERGAVPTEWPRDGWEHLARPADHPAWLPWPSGAEAHRVLAGLLEGAGLAGRGGGFFCGGVDEVEWPPFTTECLRVSWRPWGAATVEDWYAAMRKITDFLREKRYLIKVRSRPWNLATDREPYVIAYRTIDHPGGVG
ncbi:hypothetical protein ABT354_11045 [Streptomyces sp. NPDC000594]|uniref:hypothetical protein n=1 Tax=Streptomyces sp. NPDC000594 TaxID=3154261 RepID=UPI00331AA3E2